MAAKTYTPVIRALVAAALLLGSVAVTLATMNTALAAGALVIGACGAYGDAFDYRSIDEARHNALSKCKGDNCRVVTTVRRGCAAFAVDFTNPCGGNGWGKGPRLGRTQNEALKACYTDGGKECVIRSFFCDVKG